MAAAGLRERLAGLAAVEDGALPLGATALAIASLERPRAPLDGYIRHLDRLGDDLAAVSTPDLSAADRGAALAEVMAGRHGYRIDDDEATADSGLIRAIDRRRGGSAALGLIALDAARRAGWMAEALAFPPYVLLRLQDKAGGRAIVDPTADWSPVSPADMRASLKAARGLDAELAPGHYAPLGNRALLLRLQGDAKMRLLRQGEVERALAVVETTLLFAPAEEALWREAGLMHMRLGRLAAAMAALEQFAARTGNPEARRRTLRLLRELRGRLI